jgi:REP element-mobilizing transposase RayT
MYCKDCKSCLSADSFASPTDRTKMKLSVMIQQFKRACIIQAKELKINPNGKWWQRSFYDCIIRNEKELYTIRKYIQQNPLKWYLKKSIDNIDL